ncbi:hypothetical protein QN277_005695 [Acacia crassicarpa]|uniref:Uncharacterized protein n=1 Tax=Acacia crassicarpa TaxID=499986 RepID=A0AAE1IXN7_9FABA|nr:hypothetical protein QN277_005695 [Acacia crassicarpa]
MESPDTHSYVIIAWDATKDRSENDIKLMVDNVRNKSGILSAVGYQTLACPQSFAGTNSRAMEDEVRRKVEACASMLLPTFQVCQQKGVSIEVKVAAGFPVKQVILQQIARYNTDWIRLDRHLRRDLRYRLNKIPCKVALARDDFTVETWRSHHSREADVTDHKPVYSLSHVVSLSNAHNFKDPQNSILHGTSDFLEDHTKHSNASRSPDNISSSHFGSSSKQEQSGISPKGESKQNK